MDFTSDDVRSLAWLLDEHQVDWVIEYVRDLPDVHHGLAGSPRSAAIAAFGVHPLTPAQANRLADLAHELPDADERRAALTKLAPKLPAGRADQALALANDASSANSAKLLAASLDADARG